MHCKNRHISSSAGYVKSFSNLPPPPAIFFSIIHPFFHTLHYMALHCLSKEPVAGTQHIFLMAQVTSNKNCYRSNGIICFVTNVSRRVPCGQQLAPETIHRLYFPTDLSKHVKGHEKICHMIVSKVITFLLEVIYFAFGKMRPLRTRRSFIEDQ